MSIHPYEPRSAPDGGPDIPPLLCLVVDGRYVHCGQPMQTAGSEIRRLYSAAYTDLDPMGAVAADPEKRTLRCSCGFQIEVPG